MPFDDLKEIEAYLYEVFISLSFYLIITKYNDKYQIKIKSGLFDLIELKW